MRNHLDTIIRAETEGLSSLDEAVEFAVALIETGLVNSTGSNQRFVRQMFLDHTAEMNEALGEPGLVS